MTNIINWQTGTPLENGMYLVTLSSGDVTTDIWLGICHRWYEYDDNLEQVIAWCKLSDIEPYKSE